jgi:hypothetical protein
MEQVRTAVSDLPVGQSQVDHFAQMALKAYVEAAALDVDSSPSVFPVRSTSYVPPPSDLMKHVGRCSSLAVSLSSGVRGPGTLSALLYSEVR